MEINLVVLFVESIPSRIYLALLKKHGYLPKKIIHLDMGGQSKKYKMARKFLGNYISDYVLALLRLIKNRGVPKDLSSSLLSGFGINNNDISSCLDSLPCGTFERIKVSGLDDPALQKYIESQPYKTYLFTGGGMLKDPLLSVVGVRFIHIHPGIVPDIRGADCFFWSYLLRRKAGYSVFFMNSGIDTGDVLFQKEYGVQLSKHHICKYKSDTIYHALLQYYDPCLRIITLIELLDKKLKQGKAMSGGVDLQLLESIKQDPGSGRTYFFMHRRLRAFAINLLKSEAF